MMLNQAVSRAKDIHARHIRMARAGLHISIRELAELTSLNKATIVRIEAGESVRASSWDAVRNCLEEKGAEFWMLNDNGKVVISLRDDTPPSLLN